MQHSRIVGGSTAKRVIACPGSVALVAQMPPQPSSSYANEGTLLHDTIADVLDKHQPPETYLGRTILISSRDRWRYFSNHFSHAVARLAVRG